MNTQVSRYTPFDLGEILNSLPLSYDSRTYASKFPIPLFKVFSLPSALLLYKNSIKFMTMPTNPVILQFTHHNSTALQ